MHKRRVREKIAKRLKRAAILREIRIAKVEAIVARIRFELHYMTMPEPVKSLLRMTAMATTLDKIKTRIDHLRMTPAMWFYRKHCGLPEYPKPVAVVNVCMEDSPGLVDRITEACGPSVLPYSIGSKSQLNS